MLREHDSRPRTMSRVAGLAVLLLAGYLVFSATRLGAAARRRSGRTERRQTPASRRSSQRPPTLHPSRRQNS